MPLSKSHDAKWVMVDKILSDVFGKGRHTYMCTIMLYIYTRLLIPQLLEFDVELKEFQELKELPVDFQPRYMQYIQ